MKKTTLLLCMCILIIGFTFGETKTLIGIMPFKNPSSSNNGYYSNKSQADENTVAIQDAVTNAFLKSKRFDLVEREKMSQLKSEKERQKIPSKSI